MGYESKIIVMDRKEYTIGKIKDAYASKIAEFDLCNMGCIKFNEKYFNELFTNKIDFNVFVNNEPVTTDCYGDDLKYTHISNVLEWLYESQKKEKYRRVTPLISYLETLKNDSVSWNEIVIVHYGY